MTGLGSSERIAIAGRTVLVADKNLAAEVPEAISWGAQDGRNVLPGRGVVPIGEQPLALVGGDEPARARLEEKVDGHDLVALQGARPDHRVRAYESTAGVAGVLAWRERVNGGGILGVFEVRQDEAVVSVQGEDRLCAVERDGGIVRVFAPFGVGRTGRVVAGNGVVRQDELHVRVLSGDDLAHALRPHRAVHLAKGLHFEHEVELAEVGIPRGDPVESLGRPQLLSVHVLEERQEVAVDAVCVVGSERPNTLRAGVVDRTEEQPFDFIVDDRPEGGGV